jgi:hypothetical protein
LKKAEGQLPVGGEYLDWEYSGILSRYSEGDEAYIKRPEYASTLLARVNALFLLFNKLSDPAC